MESKEFLNWLDGFLSAAGHTVTDEQVKIIKSKLDSVFNKITPTNPSTYTVSSFNPISTGLLWTGERPNPLNLGNLNQIPRSC